MKKLEAAYTSHADTLGRTCEVRRFLVSVMLTTRFHLASRPISDANEPFYIRLADSSDALLSVLRESGWEPLQASQEEGLVALQPLSEWPGRRLDSGTMLTSFRRIYRRYFRGLNLPWSHLAPSHDLSIKDWPEPKNIQISVGPNIGIGDEMIFFELAQRLRHCYPDVRIESSSHNRGVWKLSDDVSHAGCPDGDQLLPYVRAAELLDREPGALVIFVEFASAPIYRHLESVPTMPRFVYLDTGSLCTRIIDQKSELICETNHNPRGGVYVVLDRMLKAIGLVERASPSVPGKPVVRTTGSARRKVFVNPFSSKDYTLLTPEWWGDALSGAAEKTELDVEIFAGVGEEAQAYSRAIARHGGADSWHPTLFGENEVASIPDTLRAAMSADLVFGLDTFTAHIGILRPVPCVTVFFGSQWDLWRVGNNHVLNLYLEQPPEVAAGLMARLLCPPEGPCRQIAAEIIEDSAPFLERPQTETLEDALELFERIRGQIIRWFECDPELNRIFVDVPAVYGEAFETALRRSIASEKSSPEPAKRMLKSAFRHWFDCNLYRYARYLSGLQ